MGVQKLFSPFYGVILECLHIWSATTITQIKMPKPAWTLGFSINNDGMKLGHSKKKCSDSIPSFTMAERVGFEPTSPWGLPDFEFYRRLLITWFLLSISVSLVRPQTRMKSGLFEKIARKYWEIAHRFQSAIFPLLERTAERTERTKIKRQYTDSSNTGKAYQDMRCIVMKENDNQLGQCPRL